MLTTFTALACGLIFGLVAGLPVTRASQRRMPANGSIAISLHYLSASAASAAFVAVPLVALSTGLLGGVLTAVTLTGATYIFAFLSILADRAPQPNGQPS